MGDTTTRKRKSPFRIKTGCIVAWRMNDLDKTTIQVNNKPVSFPDYDCVWTIPNRSDQLVGKRIRCFVNKQTVQGEVIRILSRSTEAVRIELLINDTEPNRQLDTITQEESSSLEARIRGLDKITVVTTLQYHNPNWVIQRLIPRRLFEHEPSKETKNGEVGENGETPAKKRRKKKPVIRYIGDKVDKEDQQVTNWRWMCSKFHNLVTEPDVTCQLAGGWIGKVLNVDTTAKGTLAQLTIQRLFLFDGAYYNDAENLSLSIPIEHTVMISKQIEAPKLVYSKYYDMFVPPNQNVQDAIDNHEYCEHCRKHTSLWSEELTQPNRYCSECQASDYHEQFCRQREQEPDKRTVIPFGLPRDLLEPRPIPSLKPITKEAPKPKKVQRRLSPKTVPKVKPPTPEPIIVEDYSVFKPTCARTLLYDRNKRKQQIAVDTAPKREQTRNVRDERVKHDRASRANQRRLKRHIKYNYLVNRENQIRFDRSSIHAWGVFADVFIAADEMIVEYRGELIGNAVAEQREKEYEAAKIVSDYMFRIDKETVCDATKQGNVARFINASCDPNCYTKIITVDGTKRIVIYAKQDIEVGDELCYDYKFPLEYNENKRIPCHCGAKECRGFMNWDKRYMVIPKEVDNNGSLQQQKQRPEEADTTVDVNRESTKEAVDTEETTNEAFAS